MPSVKSQRPGDALRDAAADLLTPRYGPIKKEQRADGKKVDIYFEDVSFGKTTKVYVEAKDYSKPLERNHVALIWADYSGIIANNQPAILLVVSRNGLTTDADMFVSKEQASMRHQTIRQIENDALGLDSYIAAQLDTFEEDGLARYYVTAKAHVVSYSDTNARNVSTETLDIFEHLTAWLLGEAAPPVAVLAGYGAGKSSLAKRLMSYQAAACVADTAARRPILIRLGGLTRYSSVAGLLGGMFTHEFPVTSFNFHVFSKLNEAGRLLLILDGFDEMKHAMSWSDFRHQVNDLSKLSNGNSRVLLLGRPTAFLSFEEHLQVLRGLQKFGNQMRRIVDWPQFREFELADFDSSEIEQFIERYLRYRLSRFNSALDETQAGLRIAEVCKIASKDYDLFKKPVHLKILVDLASDENVSLARFSEGLTRWDLYECFFSDLSHRETEKDARRELDIESRLDFLRELAFWLWSEKGGSVSFQVSDLPKELVVRFPEVEGGPDAQLRELLTGAFLEKKDGDTFFFGHRSFAEFLVADRLVTHLPTGSDYPTYSKLVTDGVAQFLTDYQDVSVFSRWADGLPDAMGSVELEFLGFLQTQVGPLEEIWKRFPKESPIYWVAKAYIPNSTLFFDDVDFDPDQGLSFKLIQELNNRSNAVFLTVLELLMSVVGPRGDRRSFSISVAAKLMERLFDGARVDTEARKTFVPEDKNEARKLATNVFGQLENRPDGRYIRFSWLALLEEEDRLARQGGIWFSKRDQAERLAVPNEIDIPWSEILEAMDEKPRLEAAMHFRYSRDLRDVFTREKVVKKTTNRPSRN